MKNRLLLLMWTFLLSYSTFAQVIFEGQVNENLLKGRVKQIEEFMARFNNEEDWESKKAIQTDSIYRAKFLRTLFDHSRYHIVNEKLSSQVAEKFIQDVIANDYQIHFTDSTWKAKVDCKVIVEGKAGQMTLYLQTEKKAPYEYAWVISNYDCPMLNTEKAPRPMISPMEHEVGFMGLLSLSNQGKKNATRLFLKEWKMDRLSVLAFLISHNLIRFTEIIDVSFHFQLPGYSFSIQRIERKNSYNTGWLITYLNTL